jgi:hypothetical protein
MFRAAARWDHGPGRGCCSSGACRARQAHLDGFDLHANVAVAANNRDGLEQLARYVLPPPIAQERLSRTADGRVLLTLKTEWSDGTTHLVFDPIELLERLAALTPRPRINLVRLPMGRGKPPGKRLNFQSDREGREVRRCWRAISRS